MHSLKWLLSALAFTLLLTFPSEARADCWHVIRDAAAEHDVTVKQTRKGDCVIEYNGWRSQPIPVMAIVYGVHEGRAYYVGALRNGNSLYGWGDDTALYTNVWYKPRMVEGQIFYAAYTRNTESEIENYVMHGVRTYRPHFIAGIYAKGPVMFNGEPALLVRRPSGEWSVSVGDVLGTRKFPSNMNWGPDEPSVWGQEVVDGTLTYYARVSPGVTESYTWVAEAE